MERQLGKIKSIRQEKISDIVPALYSTVLPRLVRMRTIKLTRFLMKKTAQFFLHFLEILGIYEQDKPDLK